MWSLGFLLQFATKLPPARMDSQISETSRGKKLLHKSLSAMVSIAATKEQLMPLSRICDLLPAWVSFIFHHLTVNMQHPYCRSFIFFNTGIYKDLDLYILQISTDFSLGIVLETPWIGFLWWSLFFSHLKMFSDFHFDFFLDLFVCHAHMSFWNRPCIWCPTLFLGGQLMYSKSTCLLHLTAGCFMAWDVSNPGK